jgi:hypothetical protein
MVSAPFTDLFLYVPGAEKQNIQEFVEEDPEEWGCVEELSKRFFNGIVLHVFTID